MRVLLATIFLLRRREDSYDAEVRAGRRSAWRDPTAVRGAGGMEQQRAPRAQKAEGQEVEAAQEAPAETEEDRQAQFALWLATLSGAAVGAPWPWASPGPLFSVGPRASYDIVYSRYDARALCGRVGVKEADFSLDMVCVGHISPLRARAHGLVGTFFSPALCPIAPCPSPPPAASMPAPSALCRWEPPFKQRGCTRA